MGLKIIYGRAGTGKSKYCFDEIAKKIDKEKKIYMITPEQFSYSAEKRLMETIGKDAVINVEVITLSRMAERALSELGENKREISKIGKSMLVAHILNKYKKEFKFLSKSDENIDIGMSAITELKKHGVTLEKLKEETEKTDDRYLKTKLEDINLLYQKFQEVIQDNYLEESDKLEILSSRIEEIEWLKNSIIYMDEFSGFTYPEYQVIKKLVKYAKEVNITICIDEYTVNTNPDTDIFYTNKQTLEKLINNIKEENLKIEKPIFLDKTEKFKNDELIKVEENLSGKLFTKYAKQVENIKIFLAKNQYTEIEHIAKEITKLIRDKKLRYKDISIITKNIENYANLTRAIFSRYDIPVFIDEKRELNQNIIIQYLLSIFDIFQKNFSRESVFNYIKTGFCDIEKEDIYKLENYCTKWGIKQNKWKKDFKYEIKDDEKKVEEEYFNELRKKIILPLLKLKEEIQKEKTAKNITKLIYKFIQENNIEEKIKRKQEELEEKGLIDLSNEYKESYQIIIEILDEIVTIMQETKMTIDQYYQMITVGLKNSGLGKIPGTQDQVILGDVERSRSHKVKTIFIIGMNDGSFPNIRKEEGFLGDEDREKLKKSGIELAKGTLENLYEDTFNIYKAFTTAEESIYLSYSSSDNEVKSLRPSIYVNKIKRIFPKIIEESDVITPKYDITNIKATYEELLENIAKKSEGEKIDEIWEKVYNYYNSQEIWKQKLESDMEGLKYTNLPKDIDLKIVEKLYGNTLKTSISKLERYRSCPFSYYLQYGLKLKEKEELKVQNFDTGSFMHETIDEFFKKVQEEKIPLSRFLENEEEIKTKIDLIVEEKLNEGKSYRFKETSKYKVLVARLKRILTKALKYIIESLVYSDFKIEGTEVEFDKKGKYKPIKMTLEDGKNIEIIGKIDRIDTATSDDGKYLRIIDYKSSAKNIDLNEVYAGLQIQLLTYLDAVCEEEDLLPAGVLYFSLIEQMIKADKKINEEEIENQIRANFKMKGLILADIKVIEMQDNNLINGGTSKIIPAGITKSGTINNQVTNGVDKEEFKILQKYIKSTIKEIAKEILKGKIEIKPYNKKGKTPCEYCSYKSICQFDTKICNNRYKFIDKKPKDQIIKEMMDSKGL